MTDSQTGEIEYISNKSGFDIYEVLRAAISVPIYTNLFSVKGNLINGKFFCDSPPSARFQTHVKKVVEAGVTRIIIFDSWHTDDNPRGFLFAKIFTYMRNKKYKQRQLAYFKEIESFSPPAGIEFIYLRPSKKLAMTRTEIDNGNARKIFNQGYQETLQNEELKRIYH